MSVSQNKPLNKRTLDAEATIDIFEDPTVDVFMTQAAHIADPTGGATTDSQARTAIAAILDALETAGILAAS